MNREWVTLAFGILLVLAVVAVSVRHNVPWLQQEETSGTPEVARVEEAPAAVPRKPSPPPAQPEPARVDASVPVVHRHRLGSCEGTLRVSQSGLAYSTTNRDDAFRMSFADVDQVELNAERTNLRVRQRGGRTWNFASRGDNAAALAAFSRQVERARRQTAR